MKKEDYFKRYNPRNFKIGDKVIVVTIDYTASNGGILELSEEVIKKIKYFHNCIVFYGDKTQFRDHNIFSNIQEAEDCIGKQMIKAREYRKSELKRIRKKIRGK